MTHPIFNRLPFAASALLATVALTLSAPLPAVAGTPKASVCHSGRPLSVSSSAIGGHTGHGDWVVGEEVCEDGIDNDCDGVVDDGCPVCPCFTLHDLLSWFDSGDQCFDYSVGTAESPANGTFLAYYDGEGLEAGVADYYYANVPFCAAVNLTTFAGVFDTSITAQDYADCAEIVLDAAAELGLPCSETPPAGG